MLKLGGTDICRQMLVEVDVGARFSGLAIWLCALRVTQ